MRDYWWVGLGVALFVGGAILSLAWPRMAPFVPKQQEARLAGTEQDDAVPQFFAWKQDDWAEERRDVGATLTAAEKAIGRASVRPRVKVHVRCFDWAHDGYPEYAHPECVEAIERRAS